MTIPSESRRQRKKLKRETDVEMCHSRSELAVEATVHASTCRERIEAALVVVVVVAVGLAMEASARVDAFWTCQWWCCS